MPFESFLFWIYYHPTNNKHNQGNIEDIFLVWWFWCFVIFMPSTKHLNNNILINILTQFDLKPQTSKLDKLFIRWRTAYMMFFSHFQ